MTVIIPTIKKVLIKDNQFWGKLPDDSKRPGYGWVDNIEEAELFPVEYTLPSTMPMPDDQRWSILTLTKTYIW